MNHINLIFPWNNYFLCARYNFTPLTKKTMVDLSNFPYLKDLAEDTDGSSSHVVIRNGKVYSTLHNDPFTITVYMENL